MSGNQVGAGACEHGCENEAPAGARYCSSACETCARESKSETGCDGICGCVSITESPGELWELLGSQYPTEGPAHVRAAFDVLAVMGREGCEGHRWPVYEDENGEPPTPDEVWSLATKVADAVLSAAKGAAARCDACAGEARFTCICRRCDREPDVGEKYHACAEHCDAVSNRHGLVRGVPPRWKENAS